MIIRKFVIDGPTSEFSNDTSPSLVRSLKDILSVRGLTVTFNKTSGEERVMLCTTCLNSVPAEKHPKGTGRKMPDDVQAVFDLEKNEWRSFHWSSVRAVVVSVDDYVNLKYHYDHFGDEGYPI